MHLVLSPLGWGILTRPRVGEFEVAAGYLTHPPSRHFWTSQNVFQQPAKRYVQWKRKALKIMIKFHRASEEVKG